MAVITALDALHLDGILFKANGFVRLLQGHRKPDQFRAGGR